MKVKFKKNYIDVEQVNLIRRIKIFVYSMVAVALLVTAFYSVTNIVNLSNMDSMEHENDSSSEFEINDIDFDARPIMASAMSIKPMKLINQPMPVTGIEAILPLATTRVGITNCLLLEKMSEVDADLEDNVIEPSVIETEVVEEKPIEPLEPIEESVEIVEEVIEAEPIKEYYFNLSEHEKEILCRIVEAEVTGTGSSFGTSDDVVRTCKFRIARVIINRMMSSDFPNTVEGVVFQKNQFSPLIDGRYYKVEITDLTREAVEMALDKSIPDDIPAALYFTSGKGFSSKRLSLIKRDEVGHKFYK